MQQPALFDDLPPSPGALPEGLVYQPGFLSEAEEAALITLVQQLPLREAQYKGYVARRKVASYGGRFNYDTNELLPAPPLVEALHPLRARVAAWAGVTPEALAHVLVAAYAPGTPLGWHRDVPDFEHVFGVSLGSEAVLRFRPYPPRQPTRAGVVKLHVAPRSIYAIRGPARSDWQHSVPPVAELRWSLTFRTLRHDGSAR